MGGADTLAGGRWRQEDLPTTAGLARGDRLGRFVVVELLGQGGMGAVVAAYDPDLDRRVAIKLLRVDRQEDVSASEGQQRLQREAQAMARLSHPNVVAVHEVGVVGEQVFVAMEHVAGPTLRRWLDERPRAWREVVAVFMQAGRGLAAAHAAGLVHRDFKPDNVLLHRDGRACVSDFGLASVTGAPARASPEGGTPEERAAGIPGDAPLGQTLTRTGVLLGTPAYMAPEQYASGPVDARADQFAFCVALYEALYERLPFAGRTSLELAVQVRMGNLRPPPPDSPVPGWVRDVVLRGLATDPAARFPSMEALLASLGAEPPSLRRRAALVVGALLAVAAVGAGAWALVGRPRQQCLGGERRLAAVWDGRTRDTVRAAFLGTRLPYADHAWRGVEGALDRYAREWVAMRREACEATRVRGEQPEAALDLRVACLEERLQQLAALTEQLARADAGVVEKAVAAAGSLSPVAGCADLRALRAGAPDPPRDAATRSSVEEIRRGLARARAMDDGGRYQESLSVAEAALVAARATGYRPVEAEALERVGWAQKQLARSGEAERTLEEAFHLAGACRHDEVAARVATRLVFVVGLVLARFDDGHRWARMGRAAIERLGGAEEIEARLDHSLGVVLDAQGRYDEALAELRRALAIRERLLGREHPDVASTVNNLAIVLDNQGRYEEALAENRRAWAIRERALGPDHPETAVSLSNTANALFSLGKNDEALDLYRRATAILERALGRDHAMLVPSLTGIGNVLTRQGRYDEALVHERRYLAIRERALGPDHPAVASCLMNLVDTLSLQGRHEEALVHARRAVAIDEKALGAEHPDMAWALTELGNVLRRQGRLREALGPYGRALAIREKALGADHPDTATTLGGIGQCHLGLGDVPRARALLERAVAITEARAPDPVTLAEHRFALARALWAAGAERSRALGLARQARAVYGPDPIRRRDAAAVDAWLADKRP